MRTAIHIGTLIQSKLKEDQRSPSWLAKKIHCKRDNVYKIFKRESMDTALLQDIGFALNTNFFEYYHDYHQKKVNKNDNHE